MWEKGTSDEQWEGVMSGYSNSLYKACWDCYYCSCSNSSLRTPKSFSISLPTSVISFESWPVTSARVVSAQGHALISGCYNCLTVSI